MKLEILTEAEDEIEDACRFLNRRSPGLGYRFAAVVAECLTDIAANPVRFGKVETLPDESPYRRALLHAFRYSVVFEMVEDHVLIVAVAHSSREPNYWLNRRASAHAIKSLTACRS